MSQQYALPCTCGAKVPVVVGQAGDRAKCPECGEFIDVPRLRDLKQLEPLGSANVSQTGGGHDTTVWGGLPGIVFAFGLVLIAIACFASYFTYSDRTTFEKMAKPPSADAFEFSRDIQEIALVESWDTWNEFKKINIAGRREPLHVQARARIKTLDKMLTFIAGLATLGLLLLGSSFFLVPRRGR